MLKSSPLIHSSGSLSSARRGWSQYVPSSSLPAAPCIFSFILRMRSRLAQFYSEPRSSVSPTYRLIITPDIEFYLHITFALILKGTREATETARILSREAPGQRHLLPRNSMPGVLLDRTASGRGRGQEIKKEDPEQEPGKMLSMIGFFVFIRHLAVSASVAPALPTLFFRGHIIPPHSEKNKGLDFWKTIRGRK